MKVDELIIDGFKSYATRVVISDWDPQFNAITGLNGSGKSNILDAICFVLGISSMSTVRASNLQDLIYKRGQAGVTKASVTIVFDNSDKSKAPIGFETSPTISVTRQVVLGGTSKYLINGHRAPQQSVLHLFQSVQLNINNPNFLIMQGKITKVLNMKPKEILSLIEEAAGTKMYEDRREKAERTMAKKETKLQENRALLLEEIEPKLEKLKREKRLFIEFQETQTEYEKTQRLLNAFDYSSMVDKDTFNKNSVQKSEDRINEIENLITNLNSELANLDENIEEIRKQKEKETNKNNKLTRLEENESNLSKEISRAKALLKISSDNYTETKGFLNKSENDKKTLTQELENKNRSLKSLESKCTQQNDKLGKLQEIHSKKKDLLSTLSTGISYTGEANGGYSQQLADAKSNLNDAKTTVKKYKLKSQLLKKELEGNKAKLTLAEKENASNLQDIKMCEEKYTVLRKNIESYGYNPQLVSQLREEEISLSNEVDFLNRQSEMLRKRLSNIDFQYTNPTENFDRKSVKGVAARLFELKPEYSDNAIALQVCAGGRIYNVVVDNEKTASLLLERGRLRKRVTIIPLNRVYARTLNENVVAIAKQTAPGKVELALNLISYDKEVTKAMEFIFGTSLICKDAETAEKVTFHPKIRTRSITLQGDVYDPEGTLSGGSRNLSNTMLLEIQKYNTIYTKLESVNEKLKSVRDELNVQDKIFQQTKSLQNEVKLAQHKLDIATKALQSNSTSQLTQRNNNLLIELKDCDDNIKKNLDLSSTLEKEIDNIIKDMNEFDKDKGSKLKQLEEEVNQLSVSMGKKKSEVEELNDTHQNLLLEVEQLSTEINNIEEVIVKSKESLLDSEKEESDHKSTLEKLEKTFEDIHDQLLEERKRLLIIDEEFKDLESLVQQKTETKSAAELEHKQLSNDLKKWKSNTSSIKERIDKLKSENEWLEDDGVVRSILKNNQGLNVEECRDRCKQLEERFNEMKRKVNVNIMNMIESVEKKETALRNMIKIIEKDKQKIQETIAKLNEYKRETLIKTWEKVAADFGNIFEDLLPNSFAKLVPCEGKDITEGLEVKVKLGSIWKESLVELSGGQRSLIALSLIMALLQFRPAPMYILDEVDAALDLSHTQNIGHLIKTRFKGSQFIVVSLKEGMFSNANRVFRTRFQDGTSVVSVM